MRGFFASLRMTIRGKNEGTLLILQTQSVGFTDKENEFVVWQSLESLWFAKFSFIEMGDRLAPVQTQVLPGLIGSCHSSILLLLQAKYRDSSPSTSSGSE
jgi:hypothetical protein